MKNNSGTIRFKIYDILKQQTNLSRSISETMMSDTEYNTLGSYFMVHFVYRFNTLGGKAGNRHGFGGGPRREHGFGGGGSIWAFHNTSLLFNPPVYPSLNRQFTSVEIDICHGRFTLCVVILLIYIIQIH